jgi:hypothetical protein
MVKIYLDDEHVGNLTEEIYDVVYTKLEEYAEKTNTTLNETILD